MLQSAGLIWLGDQGARDQVIVRETGEVFVLKSVSCSGMQRSFVQMETLHRGLESTNREHP